MQRMRWIFLILAAASLEAQSSVIAKNTRRVGFVALPNSGTVAGLWGYRDGRGRYCLQTRTAAGLAIIDATDPRNPKLLTNVPGRYRKVQVYKHYAIATRDFGPTQIIDLSNPAQARVVGSMSVGAHTLRVDGDKLYLNRSSRLDIYDLSQNPTSPRYVRTYFGAAHDCRPVGNTVYVNGFTTPRTRILDVGSTSTIVVIGSLNAGNHASDLYVSPTGRKILLTCDEGFGGHVQLWDVTNPGTPFRIATYASTASLSVHNVEVKGAYAYVAYYKDNLRILDLTDPAKPQEVGVWDQNPNNTGGLFSDAWEVFPDHDAIYMGQMFSNSFGPAGVHFIDFFPGFGTGSPGTGGVVPEIWWSFGPPSPGNPDFGLRLEKARPGSIALLILGTSNTRWGNRPLPTKLPDFGAPNVTLYVSPDVIVPLPVDNQGNAFAALPVPAGTPYQVLYAQWIVLDVGAPNPGKLAATRAGKLVVW